MAFNSCYKTLTDNGFTAREIRLDNEISSEFIEHINAANLNYQLASPGDHRTNPAEHAIQTYKAHMIANLSGADLSFPQDCWDLFIPQLNITLNLLRSSRYQPH